jgi:hypothetical protein
MAETLVEEEQDSAEISKDDEVLNIPPELQATQDMVQLSRDEEYMKIAIALAEEE